MHRVKTGLHSHTSPDPGDLTWVTGMAAECFIWKQVSLSFWNSLGHELLILLAQPPGYPPVQDLSHIIMHYQAGAIAQGRAFATVDKVLGSLPSHVCVHGRKDRRKKPKTNNRKHSYELGNPLGTTVCNPALGCRDRGIMNKRPL